MKQKYELKRFLVWFRNGTAFISSWLMLIILVYSKLCSHETIKTNTLLWVFLWSACASLMFAFCFTNVLIKNKGFTARLTIYMTAGFVFNHVSLNLFFGIPYKEMFVGKLILLLIILLLYFSCIAIYTVYSRKKGRIYTKALHDFQQKRRMKNGEQNSIS